MYALEIERLTKQYPNGVSALQEINLQVATGDFFALLGPNGAGKSTTIGIITSLVNKTAGKLKVFGHDIDTNFSEAKACIGLVPQEFNFNIFKPILNILLDQAGYYGIPRPLALERSEYYLKEIGLWKKRKDSAYQLSGGMKRRLMIARALVHQPKMLILDEPTAGVDIEIRRAIWELMQKINQQGTTIILTTHYLEEAESLCRNVAIIDHGKILENTSTKSLLKKLKVETFILNLATSLTTCPNLAHYTCRWIDEFTLEVDVYQTQHINELFAELSHQNIHVLSMRNKTNRLEELFLGIVSKGSKTQ